MKRLAEVSLTLLALLTLTQAAFSSDATDRPSANSPANTCSDLLTGVAADRSFHPLVPGIFHVLPTLVRGDGNEPAFTAILRQIDSAEGLAGDLFMGPIYQQSVPYYRSPNGDVWPNQTGYWLADWGSVSTNLGTRQQYIDIVKKWQQKSDRRVIQDVVMRTMGYGPQDDIQRKYFETSMRTIGIQLPSNFVLENQLWMFDRWVSRKDPKYFVQGEWIPQWAYDVFEYEKPGDWATALLAIQENELFGLPTLNLNNPWVLDNLIEAHRWYVRDAGVTQFRIDMAKHIPVRHLRTIIQRFKSFVNEYQPSQKPGFFLEFIVKRYANLRYLLSALGPEDSRFVYSFDYPLADAVRNSIFWGQNMQEHLGRVLSERHDNAIPLDTLVPILYDHDFLKPNYDGSNAALSKMAAAYAVECIMSRNGPVFYNGAEQADSSSEPGRKPISTLFDENSHAGQTMRSLAGVISSKHVSKLIANSNDVFVNAVGSDFVVLERRFDDPAIKLIVRVKRQGDPGWEPQGKLLWEFLSNDGASTRIFLIGVNP